jgi:hypothetical protein
VHLLRAPLPEPDVCMAAIGRLQGRLAGRHAGEDADLIAVLLTQGEVSGFLLFIGYDDASYTIYR